MYKAGYLVDMAQVRLDEDGEGLTWFQAIPKGTWNHPIHGSLEFNDERLQRFANNVNTGVRSQDLNIDYDHNEGVAAGWVQRAEARGDGVWVGVKWTPSAKQKLADGEYRYFSPEFQDEWTHPQTGVTHKDVLFGGGLTNRPFLKGILPINLSEAFTEHGAPAPKTPPKEGNMDPELVKKLAEKLGLGADADEAAVTAKLSENADKLTFAEPKPPKAPKQSEELTKLLAEHPVLKQLAERLEHTESALELAEVTNTVTQLKETAAAAGVGIAPADLEEFQKNLLAVPKQFRETLVNGFTKTLQLKVVKLGETKAGGLRVIAGEGGKSASERVMDAVKKLRDEDKGLSFADAISQVARTDEDLYNEYRAENYRNKAESE